MIKTLKLENFRRHAQAELAFDEGGQIVLVAGRNGVGKSTILEAITYALYGQTRHGRANVDSLVRWGAELEGMKVEMEFDVASKTYRIERRRDNKVSSATLSINEKTIITGANQVSAEVAKILGMDAVGFKLATIAQQKELDGLAKLGPTVRAQQIRRLLRLDALTAAADAARAQFRTAKDQANSLNGAVDFPALQESLKSSESKLSSLSAGVQEAKNSRDLLKNELEGTAGVEEQWQKSQIRLAHVKGKEETARSELERAKQEYVSVVIPPSLNAPSVSLSDLVEKVSEVEIQLERASKAKEVLKQREIFVKELANTEKVLLSLEQRLAKQQSLLESVTGKQAEADELQTAFDKKRKALEKIRQKFSDEQSRLKAAKEHLKEASSLSALCSHCGQAVTEEHRENEIKFATLALAKAEKDANQAQLEREQLTEETSSLEQQLEEVKKWVHQHVNVEEEVSRLSQELKDAKVRRDSYKSNSERIVVESFDEEELYARKAELAIEVAYAKEAAERAQERATALARQADLKDVFEAAQKRHQEAQNDLKNANIGQELTRAYQERLALIEKLEEENALLNELNTQKAISETEVTNAKANLAKAETIEKRRKQYLEEAVAAANASRLLKDVADRLASQIRPALEGAVGQTLNRLSEGRFTAVKIDAEYNIKVENNGRFIPLTECSGGEMDLIALAMRLSLAQIVAERHGSGGAGFLILDEPFGSQDAERREAIISSLRELKDIYGQIFLISHVGGLEEAADIVLEVSRDEDDSSSVKGI